MILRFGGAGGANANDHGENGSAHAIARCDGAGAESGAGNANYPGRLLSVRAAHDGGDHNQ